MSVPQKRILDLMKVRAHIFGQVFNPTGVRQGTSVLRARLKGPSVASYYPARPGSIKTLRALYPGYEFTDEDEEKRTEALYVRKMKGKAAPKKKRAKPQFKDQGKAKKK